MMFLLPVGGIIDDRFGILTSPGTGITIGIKKGMVWAADNQAFTGKFDADVFFPWLETLRRYLDKCLFVVVPDVVADARATIALFWHWRESFEGWPLAFVAQDGQEILEFPPEIMWSTLFIGGSTEWKDSRAAIECIERAQALGKGIHIGRVNYEKRYQFFANLSRSEKFTCDGTRPRFEGTRRTIQAWANYMEQNKRQLRLFNG